MDNETKYNNLNELCKKHIHMFDLVNFKYRTIEKNGRKQKEVIVDEWEI